MHAHVGRLLAPLLRLRDAAEARDTKLPGLARGIAYQLTEAGGTLDRATATLPEDIRAAESALHPLGVRIGKHSIFLPVLLKPAPASLAALLCALHAKLDPIPAPPLPGLTSFELDDELPQQFLAAAGFRAIGKRAVRLDILERLESNFAQSVRMKLDADVLQKEAASLLGCSNEDATRFAAELGYIKVARKGDTAKKDDAAAEASEPSYIWINPSGHQNARSPKRKNKNRNTQPTDAASPFASLAALISD